MPNKASDQTQKKDARTLALGLVDISKGLKQLNFVKAKRKIVKNGIWLPGKGCQCIKQAIAEKKVYLNKGRQILVEEYGHVAEAIKKEMRKYAWRTPPTVHQGMLHSLKLDEPIDYAFFDFFGAIDRRTAYWIQTELAPKLAEGADLVFTFAYGRVQGCNRFINEAQNLFYGDDEEYNDLSYKLSEQLNLSDTNILLYHCIIKSLFSQFDFQIKQAFKYRDTHLDPSGIRRGNSMVLLRYSNFKRTERRDGWPAIIIDPPPIRKAPRVVKTKVLKTKVKTTKTKSSFSLRAKKAWETRRKVKELV